MAITCDNCGHCYHDVSMYGDMGDVTQFERVGNEVIYHSKLIDLNDKQLRPGFHVVVLTNNETRMKMVGNCSAFNPETRRCDEDVHETDVLPEICRKLLVAGGGCTLIRRLYGL